MLIKTDKSGLDSDVIGRDFLVLLYVLKFKTNTNYRTKRILYLIKFTRIISVQKKTFV